MDNVLENLHEELHDAIISLQESLECVVPHYLAIEYARDNRAGIGVIARVALERIEALEQAIEAEEVRP